MTITLDEAVYHGLHRAIGKGQISQFIESLVRPHVMGSALDEGYKAMSTDQAREAEAAEWANGLIDGLADGPR